MWLSFLGKFDVSKNYKRPHFQLQFILALILDTGETKTVRIDFQTAFVKATKIFKGPNNKSDNDQNDNPNS